MKPLFLCYPKCSTCGKAARWLRARGIEVEMRDIVFNPPLRWELQAWVPASGLPLRKFFNTNGVSYREMQMKERLATASNDDMIGWLSSDGKLVKRPLLILPDRVLVGFRETEWAAAFDLKNAGSV